MLLLQATSSSCSSTTTATSTVVLAVAASNLHLHLGAHPLHPPRTTKQHYRHHQHRRHRRGTRDLCTTRGTATTPDSPRRAYGAAATRALWTPAYNRRTRRRINRKLERHFATLLRSTLGLLGSGSSSSSVTTTGTTAAINNPSPANSFLNPTGGTASGTAATTTSSSPSIAAHQPPIILNRQGQRQELHHHVPPPPSKEAPMIPGVPPSQHTAATIPNDARPPASEGRPAFAADAVASRPVPHPHTASTSSSPTPASPPRSITEEVVMSGSPSASFHELSGEGGDHHPPTKPFVAQDEINSLLAYPTLYDPIRRPRNPVVLCHGLYGFDTWGLEILPALRIHYWADVVSVLKGIVGIDPIITGVPGTGAVKDRAQHLHQFLKKEMRTRPYPQELNFLAHSMGGLDCRHLFASIRPTEYKPVSLTTLATPHRGSPFMAWCRANIGIGDVAKAAAAAASGGAIPSSSSPSSSDVLGALPYSLKTPLLTRQQIKEQEEEAEAAARAADKNVPSNEGGKNGNNGNDTKAAAAARKAALSTTLINFPGLNYSLGTSLASYLLDLLDSPAYSNLTPDFLNGTFNPATPNVADVRYFSVAAKAEKISITHPLWLPKLILDKTEEMEKIKLRNEGNLERLQAREWGNDGLVPIESAKWGEYLGCIENADHWQLRGSSGLKPDIKPKKSQDQESGQSQSSASIASTLSIPGVSFPTIPSVSLPSLSVPSAVSDATGEVADKAKSATDSVASAISFGWKEVNTAVGDGLALRDASSNTTNGGQSASSTPPKNGNSIWRFTSANPLSPPPATASGPAAAQALKSDKVATSTSKEEEPATKDTFSTLANVASWIVKRIPFPTNNSNKALLSRCSSINPAFPFDDSLLATTSLAISNSRSTLGAQSPTIKPVPSNSTVSPIAASITTAPFATTKSSISDTARLLFGASSPSSTSSSSSSSSKSVSTAAKKQNQKFNRERFYVALCKKLYDEGL